jgi:hypothetical protein
MSARYFPLFLLVLIILLMVYLYFFQPAVFHRLTEYPGPGGPFVNTPKEY